MKTFGTILFLAICGISTFAHCDASGVIRASAGEAGEQPQPIVSGNTKVEFVGAAPKFKYFQDKDSNGFLMVDFKQMSELNEDGTSIRSVSGWASKNFELTRETIHNDDDDVEITKVTLSLQDLALTGCNTGTASFSIDCYMPKDDTTINGVSVGAGGFKIALNVTQWDFCEDTTNLQFWFQMKGKDVKADGNTLKFQEGRVEFEDEAEIDGEKADVDVNLSGTDVKLDFPTFSDSLWYDPTVSGNGAHSFASISSLVTMCGALFTATAFSKYHNVV